MTLDALLLASARRLHAGFLREKGENNRQTRFYLAQCRKQASRLIAGAY